MNSRAIGNNKNVMRCPSGEVEVHAMLHGTPFSKRYDTLRRSVCIFAIVLRAWNRPNESSGGGVAVVAGGCDATPARCGLAALGRFPRQWLVSRRPVRPRLDSSPQ